MTRVEDIFKFIKVNKRVSWKEITDTFGFTGSTTTSLNRLVYMEKILKIPCECGKGSFYEINIKKSKKQLKH